MLVITRRPGESFFIGDNTEVFILESSPGKVRVGINAPPEVEILRTELISSDELENEKEPQA